MSNVAILTKTEARPAPETIQRTLGPAEVVCAGPGELSARVRSGAVVPVRLALSNGYVPSEGDEVLVISEAGDHYVIGVLSARAPAVLSTPGDMEIRAGGTLRLTAARAVALSGHEVSMQASTLSLLAGAVTQTFTTLRQRVREVLSVHAGQTHTVVEGASFAQSKSATIQTEQKVSINGREIFLG